MSQQLHQQANALLYQVLEQPASTRPAFLKQACGDSRALFELVNSMLSHIDQLDAFLEDQLAMPMQPDIPATQWPAAGDCIGNWRALREVKRGALGHFTLVERADDARAPVAALKIVDADALTLEELAVFHRQRELVARLAHPNIARVIDSGTIPDGRPYFVVQHCDGVALTDFCNLTGLSEHERVALFVPVCHAVHYAHRHLVLHRHLEPASIVVDRDGLVKVTDFGIAALLNKPAHTVELASEPAILAPAVAAPAAPTTALDVAALGRALAAVLADLPRGLRGDLANIVARATDKDDSRCYTGADDLARDLERFLARRPLQGKQRSLSHTLRKGARRRPVLATLAVLGVLCVGVTSALGWHRVATDSALHQRALALAGLGGETNKGERSALKQGAARGAARFLAGSAVSLADRRDQAESLYVRGHMGNLHEAIGAWQVLALAAEEKGQADIQTVALDRVARLRHIAGDNMGAHANAQELLTVLDKILLALPEHAAWRARQANALQVLGAIAVDRGDNSGAIAALRQALATREELAGEEPGPGATLDIAAARVALADGLVASADYAGAETEYRLAREVYASHADGNAQAKVWEIDLARADGQYQRKHWKTAATTIRMLRQSLGGASDLIDAKAALLEALIQASGTALQAYTDARQALPVILAASEADPDDAMALRTSALAWSRVGEIGLRAGQTASACAYLALAENRYVELAASQRAAAGDQKVRQQVARLREGCK